jgi:hypothetical protein
VAEYVGYRTQKRRQQNKKKKGLWKGVVVVCVLVAVVVVLGALVDIYPFNKAWDRTADGLTWLGRNVKKLWPFESAGPAAATKFLPEGKTSANYLISTTKQVEGMTFQSTVVLVSYDSASNTGSFIFFPNDLLVNTPGMGTDTLSNLVETDEDRIASTLVTVENLLGAQVDRYILGTDRDLRMILKQLGDRFPVNVASKTTYDDPSLEVKVDLKAGRQSLDPTTMASYMTYGPAGKELDLANRQAEWAPEFTRMVNGTGAEKFVARNANMFDTDASNSEMAGMIQAMAGCRPASVVVPVKEFKFEKTVVHRIDSEKLPAFVKTYLKGGSSITTSGRVKIELLNGCGEPGIGAEASAHIDLGKYQVVNSGNADTFDHAETLIIIYGDDEDLAASAEELRNSLEVGKLQQQPRTQNMSDISVIIGKDFASK